MYTPAEPGARPNAPRTLKGVEEIIQHLGGATACYIHLQEQAALTSGGSGMCVCVCVCVCVRTHVCVCVCV